MSEAAFARTLEFFGREAFDRIRRSSVAVIGLGGVGGHAAVALARNGVGRLLLVDSDVITESSLNRSPFALPGDIGRYKAELLAEHVSAACPGTQATPLVLFVDENETAAILGWKPDLVIDSIDSLNPKVSLLEACVRAGVPVLSSMGASRRLDPSKLRIDDISKTSGCPLARKVRSYLGRRGIRSGIRCVFSTEVPPVEAGPPDGSEMLERRGRVRRRLPGIGPLPGIFGYACAAEALRLLASPVSEEKTSNTQKSSVTSPQ
ncbi:MAG TPA: tRNA threonylcarbamoyladenosine dehydratase [Candidatus Fermentibacter daniensis]|nr:tRNA threonylcarbamoyladenosine dehydratase [Candidatus Fermentibacter daniensis]HOR07461.1 tRNA threonylcarbamoyladenosine dehydratase [Candidatus Fermentibacter daniensis]HPK52527.1 tRNA threonylcarbamoyladenosine dehydratase [Candidatus Fermentibacter daniensis]HQH93360.1 tRNA threonylcarbamoyladenosine dehydratase [Candidatus Fermentibacter daniensis]